VPLHFEEGSVDMPQRDVSYPECHGRGGAASATGYFPHNEATASNGPPPQPQGQGRQVRQDKSDDDRRNFHRSEDGSGNLGVVTEFEVRLHQVGPMVEFGPFSWEVERGDDALRAQARMLPFTIAHQ
jgi:hypothetical protein